jgi:hypothetical protein
VLVLTLEYRDGSPSKQSKPLHPEEAHSYMRELMFRLALGEYAAVYVTLAKPLDIPEGENQ